MSLRSAIGAAGRPLVNRPPITVEMLGARCSAGQLQIDPTPEGDGWDVLVRQGNFHVYDYALFTMNIRANAQQRAAAYLASDARR